MELLRLVLLLVASIRLMQPNALCDCQMAEVFDGLLFQGHACCDGESHSCHSGSDGVESFHSLVALADTDEGNPDPVHQHQGRDCGHPVALPVAMEQMDRADWNPDSPQAQIPCRYIPSGKPNHSFSGIVEPLRGFRGSYPRHHLLNRSMLL